MGFVDTFQQCIALFFSLRQKRCTTKLHQCLRFTSLLSAFLYLLKAKHKYILDTIQSIWYALCTLDTNAVSKHKHIFGVDTDYVLYFTYKYVPTHCECYVTLLAYCANRFVISDLLTTANKSRQQKNNIIFLIPFLIVYR